MSLTVKFAVFTSLLCIGIIAGTSFLSYQMAHRDLVASLGEKLESIAATGALGIDGDLHETLHPTKENAAETHSSEAFLTIRDHLRAVKDSNKLKQEIYTFRREGGKLHYIVMTHERPYVDTYDIKPEMLPTLNDGMSAHTGIYGDENGHWVSGYAPIRDAGGSVVGLLEVDLQVDEVVALTRDRFMAVIYKSLAFVLIALVGSFLLAKGVTGKINHLTDVTEKISLGKMDTPILIGGNDEVARLGASLERMRESLKIAAELIDD